MLRKHVHLDNQAQFFYELNLLRAKLPEGHPAQAVHAILRGSLIRGLSTGTPKDVGYHRGMWGVFVPTKVLYIEIVNTLRNPTPEQRKYRDILAPLGYRFVITDNYAEAVLLVMRELGIKDPIVERNMLISERQIDGNHMLLRRQVVRASNRRKRERAKDRDESTKRRIGDIS